MGGGGEGGDSNPSGGVEAQLLSVFSMRYSAIADDELDCCKHWPQRLWLVAIMRSHCCAHAHAMLTFTPRLECSR